MSDSSDNDGVRAPLAKEEHASYTFPEKHENSEENTMAYRASILGTWETFSVMFEKTVWANPKLWGMLSNLKLLTLVFALCIDPDRLGAGPCRGAGKQAQCREPVPECRGWPPLGFFPHLIRQSLVLLRERLPVPLGCNQKLADAIRCTWSSREGGIPDPADIICLRLSPASATHV